VDVVGRLGTQASVGDRSAGVRAPVVGHGHRAGASDGRQPGGGHRLTRDRESRPRDVDPGVLRRLAQGDRGARERPEMRGVPCARTARIHWAMGSGASSGTCCNRGRGTPESRLAQVTARTLHRYRGCRPWRPGST
jgi:hypothetical protein